MKMISKVNGPITTSIAQSSFDPTGQDFIVAYKIDRECFLSQIKEKVSTELWFSIMEYEKECLNPFLTNYLFHILELHRLHARNYEGVLDDVKQFLSGFDDVVDNETKVTCDVMFQDCQETYEAVIRFYHDSLNTWASSHQTASDLKPLLEKPSGLILTKQLLDKYESYKDDTVNDAVNKVRNQGYKLSTKKATMLFWFFVYRIVKNAKYTTPDGKTLTAESFVKVLGTGKGISHNTLNDYDTELSSRRGGAPGEIIINEKLKYEANDIYSTLRDRIMNE